MTKARIWTTAGIIPLMIATLLSLMFLTGQPVPVASSALGFTPTFTPSPTPTSTPTPTATPAPPPPPPSHAPHLMISKTAAPAQVLPGGQVTFVIKVCNDGDATADNVVVSDVLPPELEVVSASASQGMVTVQGNELRADLGSSAAGTCAEVTIVARVRPDVPPGTQITNAAIADGQTSEVTVPVVGLLPESGRTAPLTVAVGLLVLGVGSLIMGLALKARDRAC